MKVFLDTNVLTSAVATRGLCADVLREVFSSHKLFISDQVLTELRRVLRLKFRVTRDLADEFMWLLKQDSVSVKPGEPPRIELKDKHDLAILGAAVGARVEVLVTGDEELLGLGAVGNVQILSPRQFWEKLRADQRRRAERAKRRRLD